VRLSRF
jgi:hypothetical protein